MNKSLDKNDCLDSLMKKHSQKIPRPVLAIRNGWSEEAQVIANDGEDLLILGEFPNLEDKNLDWEDGIVTA